MANTMILDILTAVEGIPVDSAPAGATVVVAVRLKNITSFTNYIAVTGAYDSAQLIFSPAYYNTGPNQTAYFEVSFVMPGKDVLVWIAGGYWDSNYGDIVYESYMEKQLLLQAAAPQFYDFRIAQYQKL